MILKSGFIWMILGDMGGDAVRAGDDALESVSHLVHHDPESGARVASFEARLHGGEGREGIGDLSA